MLIWLLLLVCGNSSELNTPKLDGVTRNQMHQLLAKQIVCEEFKQAKEKQAKKPMLAQLI